MEARVTRRGLMLVLSSPSGAGKTTLAGRLVDEDDNITMSVSHTTREKRKGEKDGRDYHFVDKDTFTRMRDQGEFLEWAVVFDNYYGTTRKPVEQALADGRDVLFDIDWQGAEKLRKNSEGDVVTVFILPPSARALEERLTIRAEDSEEVVRKRIRGASNEIPHWEDYDYVIVNYEVEQSAAAVRAILTAERQRRARLIGLEGFVQALLAEL